MERCGELCNFAGPEKYSALIITKLASNYSAPIITKLTSNWQSLSGGTWAARGVRGAPGPTSSPFWMHFGFILGPFLGVQLGPFGINFSFRLLARL